MLTYTFIYWQTIPVIRVGMHVFNTYKETQCILKFHFDSFLIRVIFYELKIFHLLTHALFKTLFLYVRGVGCNSFNEVFTGYSFFG